MQKTLLMTAASCLALMAGSQAAAASFEKNASGMVVKPDQGAAKEVRLEVMGENIIHVVKVDQAGKTLTPSMMTVAKPCACSFTVAKAKDGESVTLKAGKIAATVSLKTGAVQFFDAKGKLFLSQAAETMAPVSVGGKPYMAIKQGFNHGTKDAYYGLGQHMNAQMNMNGEDVLLQQHNMEVAIPFVVSDKNYGLLWDNNSISRFGDATPYGPLTRDLKVVDDEGKAGGLTARYYVGGKLMLTRHEGDIAYQYLKDVAQNWPTKELGELKTLKDVKVVWDATLTSGKSGAHKMQLYASDYATLTIDGKQVLDVWRQNWNPFYHNFEVNFTAGKPVKLHLEWKTESGMIAMTHNDPLPDAERHSLTFSSEIAERIDYHVISGENMDKVIAGYRHLTGQAPMMPKWAYGFWQSRQRYETQEQILGVVDEYRKRGWPLDVIVQDWFYWPQDGWGSHDFDKARFPDPKGMVDKIHKQNARVMISVWGKFYPNTDNYKELAAKGHMWTKNVENGALDWVGPGYKNSHYDPYTKEARDIYYRQMQKLVKLGFDAWWADNTEPDVLSNSRLSDFKQLIGPTAYGPGEVTFNTYSLAHTDGVYAGLKRDQPDTRQFILSRSGFAGVQRNSVAVWSGDVVGRWNDLYNQISAGVNFSLSGIPNWSHDIGGYAQETRYQAGDVGSAQENRSTAVAKMKPEDEKEWQELNLRWFQFGAFSPVFRSHGEVVKREIYNIAPEGSEMRESMLGYLKLRYRLMPYIYATASDTHHNSGTIMRGLVMDYPQDEKVKDIKDQFLFGHDLLVAPVTTYGERERSVYLPKGAAWYDFYTGQLFQGGASAVMKAPLARIPVLVRAGAIVPTGPVTQYVDEKPDAALTINVYTGADGKFSLYEDDGVTRAYERGEFSRIPLSYNDKTGVVTIGQRSGKYKGMVSARQFKVRFIKPGMSSADEGEGKVVNYNGKAVTIKL